MPREQVYSFQGSGTVLSCEVQAFLVLVGSMGCLCYNSGLALFHICLIQFQTSERVMRKRIEPLIHVFSLLIPLSIAVRLVCSVKCAACSVQCAIILASFSNLTLITLLFNMLTPLLLHL